MRHEKIDLGHEIYFYDGADPERHSLSGFIRFLDVLWLPQPLSKLTAEQITVINRYRERHINQESFVFAQRAREALCHALGYDSARSIVEVGCGKFPIAKEFPDMSYFGIDIDEEAIIYCRKNGLQSGFANEFDSCCAVFDTVVSLYAFHFKIEQSLIDILTKRTSENSVVVFNLIAVDATDFLLKLANFSIHWNVVRVVKMDFMSKKEFFVILGRLGASDRVARIAEGFLGFAKLRV